MRATKPWVIAGLFAILLALLPVNASAQDITDVPGAMRSVRAWTLSR